MFSYTLFNYLVGLMDGTWVYISSLPMVYDKRQGRVIQLTAVAA